MATTSDQPMQYQFKDMDSAFCSQLICSPGVFNNRGTRSACCIHRRMVAGRTGQARSLRTMAASEAPVAVSTSSDIVRQRGANDLFNSSVTFQRVVRLSGVVAKTNMNGTITQQTEEILAQIDAQLSASGTKKDRLLTANVYLQNIDRDFKEFNAVWVKWRDSENMPVRATVGAGLVSEFDVEIQVSAALPDRSGRVETNLAAAAIGPYNQGVVSKQGTLYVSGCIGLMAGSGELAGPDMASQAKQALKNLSEIVKAAGGTLDDVVKTVVIFVDIADFARFNLIYSEFFGGVKAYPARSAYAAKELPKGALVEIEAIADLP